MERPPVKLLDRVRNRIRVKGYSIRTEQSYASWIRRFILLHNKRHPQDIGKARSRLTLLTWQSPGMFPPLLKIRRLMLCCFFTERIWSRLLALCFGKKIQKRRHGICLEVCVSS